jgi:DNA-binding NtrC family response regulator
VTAIAEPSIAHAVLVVNGPEPTALAALIRNRGYELLVASRADALTSYDAPVSLCVVDLAANSEALKAARAIRAQHPRAVVIGIADPARPMAAADAIRAGVFDVLPQPPTAIDLDAVVANAREQRALAAAGSESTHGDAAQGIVSISPGMRIVMELVRRAAPGRCGIVVTGERGSGHEMIARAVHSHGPRPDAPFVSFDCVGSADDDIEAALFGSASGTREGRSPERRTLERIGTDGRLHAARSGTIFLKNVLELPARVQMRLVRVLRDREVVLEGDGDRPARPFDVRPIASVEGSLEGALEEGRLRPDLYERLSLIRMDVPSLRERREDIPVLASHFVKALCRSNGVPLKTLTRPALTLLQALPWRGNAPELRGLLERLVLLIPHGLIRLEDVLAHTQIESSVSPTGLDATLRQARNRFERDYIAAVLHHQHGRIAEAARVLGIQRTNLYRKMRRLNLIRTRTSGKDA